MHGDSHKHQREFLAIFDSVQTVSRHWLDGREVLVSHFPYVTGGEIPPYEVANQQYRLLDQGRWLLHGHTHDAGQRVHGRQVHIGVDAWSWAPVAADVVVGLMRALRY